MRATLRIKLPGHITLDAQDALFDKLTETATPEFVGPRVIEVYWEAIDGWTLRGHVDSDLQELEAEFGHDVIDASALIDAVDLDVTR